MKPAEKRTPELLDVDVLSRLWARVAHEIRAPLGTILMWTHVLRRGRDADRDSALDAIDASVEEQTRLIRNIVDLSRVVAGTLTLDRQPVDVADRVRIAASECEREAKARDVVVRLDTQGSNWTLTADPAWVARIVSLLLAHGIASAPLGGRIDVRLIDLGDDGVEIVLGDGSDVQQDFRRTLAFLGRGPEPNPPGGAQVMGLALALRLVELHGGNLRPAEAGADGAGTGPGLRAAPTLGGGRLQGGSGAFVVVLPRN